MHEMNKSRPDLNLLVVFDAVRHHRQVTAAARALALSQPAVSHALNRLRDILGDPLFIRTATGLVPTPKAESMAANVTRILALSAEVFGQVGFAPELSERRFHVAVTEYSTHALMPQIFRALRLAAPNTGLESEAIGADTLPRLQSGETDCAFWGAVPPPEPYRHVRLYREHFVGYICPQHALATRADAITLDDFLAYPHAIVRLAKTGASPMDEALDKIGRRRRVVLGSSSFSDNLTSLPGTDLIFSVPSRFARVAAEKKLVAFRLPIEVPEFDYSLIWHSRLDTDPGFAWFRRLVIDATASQAEPV